MITNEDSPEKAKFHFLINDLSVTSRYRYQQNQEGQKTHNQLQGRVNLDASIFLYEDRIRIDLQGGTGDSFGSSWSNTGIGEANSDVEVHLRRISLKYQLSDFFEGGVGSFAPEYGAGSQVTSLDGDGYVLGYKAKVSIDDTDVTVTAGSLGSASEPSVFHRIDGFREIGYVQALVHQRISEILAASIDYTLHDNDRGRDHVFRATLGLSMAELTSFIERLQIEYAHGSSDTQTGKGYQIFGLSGRKTLEDFWGKRDFRIDASFHYLSTNPRDLGYPTHSVHIEGAFYRLQLNLLDLFESSNNKGKWALYTRWNQSLENAKQFRIELGMGFSY